MTILVKIAIASLVILFLAAAIVAQSSSGATDVLLVKKTNIGTCFRVNPAFQKTIQDIVATQQGAIATQRALGKLIAYISTPIGPRGGGDFELNREISKFLRHRLERRFGPGLWVLSPEQVSIRDAADGSRAGDGDYMYMWTQILTVVKAGASDVDLVAITGPNDVHSFFGPPDRDLLGLVSRFLQSNRSKYPSLGKIAASQVATREFIAYYGLKMSGAMSLGSHDEWNLFAAINKMRREGPDRDSGINKVYEQIPVYFDGRLLSPAELETRVTPGYEVPCNTTPPDPLASLEQLFYRTGGFKSAVRQSAVRQLRAISPPT